MSDSAPQAASASPANDHAIAVSKMTPLKTRTGFEFSVRPVEPIDEPALARLFDHVGKDDMRFRFLSAMKTPGHQALKNMIDVDHDRKEDYLAIAPDGKTIIASAVVAADAAKDCAEVAIAMHRDFKRKGVGWIFLEYVAAQEKAKGVRTLQSIETRENHEAIELERQMGFKATSYLGDASLILLELDLTQSTQ
jgi:N-acetylglutamate synthase-like GNAT family acetyltransferase